MMGAMPAVAVRLERRKAEQRMKRPSQLYLGGYPPLRQQTASPSKGNSPSPSPLLSPPRQDEDQRLPEVYVCGRVSALHLAVVSLLLGAVILIVGLVQLKPGADAPGHKYYLIAVGCVLEVLGLIITATRCVLLHSKIKKRRSSANCSSSSSKKGEKIVQASSSSHVEVKEPAAVIVNGKNREIHQPKESVSPCESNSQRHLNLKHLYNSSDVMYADELSDSTTDMAKSKSPIGSLNAIDVVMGSSTTDIVPQVVKEARSLSAVSQVDVEGSVVVVQAALEKDKT